MSNSISFTGVNLAALYSKNQLFGRPGERVVLAGANIIDELAPKMRGATGPDNAVNINAVFIGTSETAANLTKLLREGKLTKELALQGIQRILGTKSDLVIKQDTIGRTMFPHPEGKISSAKGRRIMLTSEQFYNNVRGFIKFKLRRPKTIDTSKTGRFAIVG